MADNETNEGNQSTPTPEEQIAELTAKLDTLMKTSETQAAEMTRLSKDKDSLLKDLKKVKDERESLRQAQMTEDERKAAEAGRLGEVEKALAKANADALRYKILSTTNHGLDPVLARLVEGDDEATINASIEALKLEQAEFTKRLTPAGGKGTGPEPPPNGGGPQPLMLSEDDIRRMNPAQFAELEGKIKAGEVVLP